jgi:predicted GIY-YIG superfamily endonuclease
MNLCKSCKFKKTCEIHTKWHNLEEHEAIKCATYKKRRPQRRLKVAKRATNKQMATAIWKELKKYKADIPVKEEIRVITKRRLNFALKKITKA